MLKKYRVELVMLSVLLVCVVAYIAIKANNPGGQNADNNSSGPWNEEIVENQDDDTFYNTLRKISETDFLKKQVVGIGEKVRQVGLYIVSPHKFRYDGNNDPNVNFCVEKVCIADKLCGLEEKNRKYLVIYAQIDNLYKGEIVWPIGYSVLYHKDGENYLHITGDEERHVTPVKHSDTTSAGYCFKKEKYKEVLGFFFEESDTGGLYHFDAEGDKETLVYIPEKSSEKVKLVLAIDTDNPRYQDGNSEITLIASYSSSGYNNGDIVVRLPYDKIEYIENVNYGYDDSGDGLYSEERRMCDAEFFSKQLKRAGDTVRCYADNDSTVDVTLSSYKRDSDMVELKLNLKNTGNKTIIWGKQKGFNIVVYDSDMWEYNYRGTPIDSWSEAQYFVDNERVAEVEIEPGTNKDVRIVVPVDMGKIPSYVRKYAFAFQLITPKLSLPNLADGDEAWKYSNKDFAFKI